MPGVTTVLGTVAAAELGVTMAHEHVLFDLATYYTPAEDAPPGVDDAVLPGTLWWLRNHPMQSKANLVQDDTTLAADEVSQFVSAGGRTIVDQTVVGLGPRPLELAGVSRRTGAHIVAGTGFYVAGSYPAEIAAWSRQELADHLRRELSEGIAGTDVRAGMIGELGVSDPVLPFEERLLAAAAQVQADLGCAVAIHTPWGVDGAFAAAAAAESAGLDPARTALCHLDNRFAGDVGRYVDVARRGFVLSLDCFGRDCYYPHVNTQLPSDAQRIGAVAGLLDAGLGGQLLLSQDICFVHELTTSGGHGYAHVVRTIVPRLRAAGVDAAAVRTILIDNPRDWLAGPSSIS